MRGITDDPRTTSFSLCLMEFYRIVFAVNNFGVEGEGMKTYEIVEDGQAIKCKVCEYISHHPLDIKYQYCLICHELHSDLGREVRLTDVEKDYCSCECNRCSDCEGDPYTRTELPYYLAKRQGYTIKEKDGTLYGIKEKNQ